MHAEKSALAGEKMAPITGVDTDRQQTEDIKRYEKITLYSLKYCSSRSYPPFPHYFNLKHLPLSPPPIVFRARKKFNLF